jgi:alpha-glucosidase (family GH31 glycosyl hydrolase)
VSSCHALGLLVLAACGGGRDAGPPVEADLAGFHVEVVPGEGRVVVHGPDGALTLDTGAGGFALGRGDQAIEHRFGMFLIEERAREVRTATSFGEAALTGGAITFALYDEDDRRLGTGRIAGDDAIGDGALTIEVTAEADDADRAAVSFGCAADEHFLGLGGQSFDVDHRGQRVPLWVSEDGISKDPTDEPPAIWALVGRRHTTHSPIPAFLSSRGFAALLDTPAYAVFDLCAADAARVTLEAWEPTVRLRLFAGDSAQPLDAVRLLTAHVGRPRIPPEFAFAPWLDAIFGSANVRRVAAKLRAEDIPASAIWTEDWRGGADTGTGYALEEDWDVDRALYPDFEAMADDLHAAGFKLLTYHNSFLVDGSDAHAAAIAGGHTIRDATGAPYHFDGPTFAATSLLDLSSPAARTWAKQQLATGFAQGADGHMADFAEWLPTDAVLASGEPALLAHNRYAVEWARLQREVIDEQTDGVERLFFARAAHLGSQSLIDVVWPGDQQTDFTAGDGLPSVIPMGIGLGVVGFPYFGSDVGGYMSQLTAPTSRELWFRWVTLGALSPVMRTHHGRSARQNWSWESDAASTAHLARWARFHQRLLPYFLACAREAALDGTPMLRPLALAHPTFEPGWTATDQYLLGSQLYVAPIVSAGATTRTVALPAGTYHPLIVDDAGREVRSGAPIVVGAGTPSRISLDAALADIPVLVRAGAMLVLLPAGVDTVVASVDPSVTTLADVGDDRELLVWGGGDASLTEASGLSYAWTSPALAAPLTATWNDAPVAAVDGVFTVTGTGTLMVNGSGALTIIGGAATRTLRVRVTP